MYQDVYEDGDLSFRARGGSLNCFGRRFLESDWIVPKNGGFEVDN